MAENLGSTEKELIENRIEKLHKIEAKGINPYPARSERDFSSCQIHEEQEELISSNQKVIVAGRLMARRGHGRLSFLDVYDETGKIQVVCKVDSLGESSIELLELLDVGDFIEASGTVFVTKAGEVSVEAQNLRLLSKSLRPLPEKWHGLKDEETRLRKRYLEFATDPLSRELFCKRAKFWTATRAFLIEKGFLEVETPVLENTAGGADANPFITHHNALDIDVYLRISMGELWQKRLMVGGFEKTFEIGRQFRNEGISREHLQDYTQMEFYWAYANYLDSMQLVEEMYKYIAKEAFGTLQFIINGFDVNLEGEWPKIDYVSVIKEKQGIDVLSATDDEIKDKLKELHIKFNINDRRGRLIDTLWKQIRKGIAGPAFLINHPVEVSPLAKRKQDNSKLVERYQVILAGSEMGNGYSELNDPIDQAGRFAEQAKMREEGDIEAQMHDSDFVEALEYGMPPTSGFGFSERLFSFLLDLPIREAQMFPLMKPEAHVNAQKKGETKVATVVINKGANLATWQEMNTVAHLNASFAARNGRSLLLQDKIATKDDQDIKLNIEAAIMIKEAVSNQDIVDLIKEANHADLEVYEFIRPMIETSDDKKLIEIAKSKLFSEIEFLGILVYGRKAVVDKITEKFPLIK